MPKLSIVVPTRERSDTLFHTLRTLVEQDYQDCEIIISDNNSNDNTEEIVKGFDDARIRYINTKKRLSMSGNWEFALGYARGDFITYIGDDDGFVPGAITKAMNLIMQLQANALVWNKIDYQWPDNINKELRNLIIMKRITNQVEEMCSQKTLRQVTTFCEDYTKLPCVYNSIIRRTFMQKIIELSTNKVFFNSISPDVFSGIVLALVMNNYFHIDYPFSVNGASRHSGGSALMSFGLDIKDDQGTKFLKENTYEYDYRLKMGPSIKIAIMGEYLLAKKFLPALSLSEPNWNCYVRALRKEMKFSSAPEQILNSVFHTAKCVGLKIKISQQVKPPIKKVSFGMQKGFTFIFRVPENMVGNVYDACELVSGMLPEQIKTKKARLYQRIRNSLVYRLAQD